MTSTSLSSSPERVVIPPSAEPAPSEKPASPETPQVRYVRQINSMLMDAVECRSLESLTDTLAWGLAVIGNRCGAEVTGDIIRRVGRYLSSMAAQDKAEAEAQQAKQEGQRFQ